MSERFIIEKDAHSYLSKHKKYDSQLNTTIANYQDFSYLYAGDEDFKKYFRVDAVAVKQIAIFYKDISLFVKNLNLGEIMKNVEKISLDVFPKIAKITNNKKSLIICNVSPLEGVLLGEVFREYGCKNLAVSLNRKIGVNQQEKTFEAALLMFLYAKSSFLQTSVQAIVEKIKQEQLLIVPEKLFILIDENNATSSYNHFSIDNYLKTQIGFHTPKNIYRLDKYPDISFLESKEIEMVVAFDSDNDVGNFMDYYKDEINSKTKGIVYQKSSYAQNSIKNIGFYEEYLVEKNGEYLNYKKELEKELARRNPPKTPEYDYQPRVKNNDNAPVDNQLSAAGFYIVAIPIMIILGFAYVGSGGSSTPGGYISTGSSSGGSSYGGSSGGSSSSWSSSDSSSKSSGISSFGGGGFSKGGG